MYYSRLEIPVAHKTPLHLQKLFSKRSSTIFETSNVLLIKIIYHMQSTLDNTNISSKLWSLIHNQSDSIFMPIKLDWQISSHLTRRRRWKKHAWPVRDNRLCIQTARIQNQGCCYVCLLRSHPIENVGEYLSKNVFTINCTRHNPLASICPTKLGSEKINPSKTTMCSVMRFLIAYSWEI